MKNINLLKKSFTAITLLFCTIYLNGQINEQLTTKPWLDKEKRIIFGHAITQIFGESPGRAETYNFSPITSIAYQDLNQILNEIKTTAKKENWSEEKLNKEIEKNKQTAQGGRILLYLTRYSEDRANTKWFFIIIRDKIDKEIWRVDLPYQAPELPDGRGWWNFIIVNIDKKIEEPFYVYIDDKQSNQLSDFKFLVDEK